jgi:hypothetical protein
MNSLKLLLPNDMSGLVDLTELVLSNWGIEGAHVLKANVSTMFTPFRKMIVVIHSFTNDVYYSYPHLLQA